MQAEQASVTDEAELIVTQGCPQGTERAMSTHLVLGVRGKSWDEVASELITYLKWVAGALTTPGVHFPG